jgi:hypothetical protein
LILKRTIQKKHGLCLFVAAVLLCMFTGEGAEELVAA